jgi:hypothetical protein
VELSPSPDPRCDARSRRRSLAEGISSPRPPSTLSSPRLPRSLALSLSTARRPNHRHGRRLPPPFCASPSFPGVPCRSASPPSSSPTMESARGGQNRRRHSPFPRRCPRSPPPIRRAPATSDSAGPAGVLRVSLLPVFPCSPSFPGRRRAPPAGEPSPAVRVWPGQRPGLASPVWPTWPGPCLANVALGPIGQPLG